MKHPGDLAEKTETRIPPVCSEAAERVIKELGDFLGVGRAIMGRFHMAISKTLYRIAKEGSE